MHIELCTEVVEGLFLVFLRCSLADVGAIVATASVVIEVGMNIFSANFLLNGIVVLGYRGSVVDVEDVRIEKFSDGVVGSCCCIFGVVFITAHAVKFGDTVRFSLGCGMRYSSSCVGGGLISASLKLQWLQIAKLVGAITVSVASII